MSHDDDPTSRWLNASVVRIPFTNSFVVWYRINAPASFAKVAVALHAIDTDLIQGPSTHVHTLTGARVDESAPVEGSYLVRADLGGVLVLAANFSHPTAFEVVERHLRIGRAIPETVHLSPDHESNLNSTTTFWNLRPPSETPADATCPDIRVRVLTNAQAGTPELALRDADDVIIHDWNDEPVRGIQVTMYYEGQPISNGPVGYTDAAGEVFFDNPTVPSCFGIEFHVSTVYKEPGIGSLARVVDHDSQTYDSGSSPYNLNGAIETIQFSLPLKQSAAAVLLSQIVDSIHAFPLPHSRLREVHVHWEHMSVYENHHAPFGGDDCTCYQDLWNEIRIKGNSGSAWKNGGSIRHELGHHYHAILTDVGSWDAAYGNHPSEGHAWDSVHDTEASAFGEGWAGFFEGWARSTPTPRSRLGSSANLQDPDATRVDRDPNVDCRGSLRECAVGATLWSVSQLGYPRSYIVTAMDEQTPNASPTETVTWGIFSQVWKETIGSPDLVLEQGDRYGLARWGDGASLHDARSDIGFATQIEPGRWVDGDLSVDPHPCCTDEQDHYKSILRPRTQIKVFLDPKGHSFDLEVTAPEGTGPIVTKIDSETGYKVAQFQSAGYWAPYYFKVKTADPHDQGVYRLKVHPIVPYIKEFPTDPIVGETYRIVWGVDGNDTYDHAGLHWGYSPTDMPWHTDPEAGTPPREYEFTNYESAPSVLYFRVHAHMADPSEDVYSAVAKMTVHDVHATINRLWVDDLPPVVEAHSVVSVCWHVDGSGRIKAKLWGLSGGLWPLAQEHVGFAPMDVCEDVNTPWNTRDFYVELRVVSDDEYQERYTSPQVSAFVHHNYIWATRIKHYTGLPALNEPTQQIKWRVYGDAPIEWTSIEQDADGQHWYLSIMNGQGNDDQGTEFVQTVVNPVLTGGDPGGAIVVKAKGGWEVVDAKVFVNPILLGGNGGVSTDAVEETVSELVNSIEIQWLVPPLVESLAGEFKIYQRSNGGETLIATVGPTERRYLVTGLTNGQSAEYRVAVVTEYGEVGSDWLEATPEAGATASTSYAVTGTAGSNGWHRSPISIALTSTGQNNGAYAGVDTVEIIRDEVSRGSQAYIEEFETTVGWSSTTSNPLTAISISQGASSQQAFGSVQGVFLNDPVQSGDSAPRMSKSVSGSVAGYDTAQIFVKYDTTSTATNPKGKFDIVLYGGPEVVWRYDNAEVINGWNRLTLPVAGAGTIPVTRLELVLHEARKDALTPSAEQQTFTFDGLRFSTSSQLREEAEGIHVWGTIVNGDDSSSQETQHQVYRLDWTEPSTAAQVRSPDTASWYNSPVTLTLVGDDEVSGLDSIMYRIGNGALQTYSAPFTISSEGQRYVEYYGRDRAGNEETVHNEYSVWLDMTPPSASIGLAGTGDGTWYSTDVVATATPSDGLSGVSAAYVRVDGGPWYVIPQGGPPQSGSLTVTSEGSHVVEAYTVDKAGNKGPVASRTFTIERHDPVVRTRSPAPGTAAVPSVEVVATHDDLGGAPSSGIQPSLTSFKIERSFTGAIGPWTDITTSGSLSRAADMTTWKSNQLGGLQPATYRITGTIYDRAGNSATLQGTGWTFTIGI